MSVGTVTVRRTLKEAKAIEKCLYKQLSPIHAFIHSSPIDRNPAALPIHWENLIKLFDEVLTLEDSLHPEQFNRMRMDIEGCQMMVEEVKEHMHEIEEDRIDGAFVQWECLPGGGRRRWFDLDLLRDLVELKMTDVEIAEHFDCCSKTIQRARKRDGIPRFQWSPMDYQEILQHVLRVLNHGSGDEGEVMVRAALEEHGVFLRRETIRAALEMIGRQGLRGPPRPLIRRIYRVPWINALWHIDGHHKLIPWKIVIHGGIDGFSRMVVFLQASNNNRAATVYHLFEEAVEAFGWPNRVRGDYGKENWDVKYRMEEVRGLDRGSFIQGPSTHNQRIERLWVDVKKSCVKKWRNIFTNLERAHLLHPACPIEIWVLHFCYLPILNAELDSFTNRWNLHGIRTANYNSPRLIWMRNRLQARKYGLDPLRTPLALIGEDDPEINWHRQSRFKFYGVDGQSKKDRKTKDEDPHVELPTLSEQVPADVAEFIMVPTTTAWLADVAGVAEPWTESHWAGRFARTLHALKEQLWTRFPAQYN